MREKFEEIFNENNLMGFVVFFSEDGEGEKVYCFPSWTALDTQDDHLIFEVKREKFPSQKDYNDFINRTVASLEALQVMADRASVEVTDMLAGTKKTLGISSSNLQKAVEDSILHFHDESMADDDTQACMGRFFKRMMPSLLQFMEGECDRGRDEHPAIMAYGLMKLACFSLSVLHRMDPALSEVTKTLVIEGINKYDSAEVFSEATSADTRRQGDN